VKGSKTGTAHPGVKSVSSRHGIDPLMLQKQKWERIGTQYVKRPAEEIWQEWGYGYIKTT